MHSSTEKDLLMIKHINGITCSKCENLKEDSFKGTHKIMSQDIVMPQNVLKNVKVDWLNIDKKLKDCNQKSALDNLKNNQQYKYAVMTREQMRIAKMQKERESLAKPVTDRTVYNTRQLHLSGVPNREIKKYLKLDGHVTDEGQKILKEHGRHYM